MLVKVLTLLLVAFAFQNFGANADFSEMPSSSDVLKDAGCIVPRILNRVPFLHYSDTTSCPNTFGPEDKKYCCLNTSFKVECCDIVHYVIFGLVCLSPVISVLISFCCCCYCFFYGKMIPCS